MITNLQKNIKRQLSKNNLSVTELERRAGIPHAVVNILHGRSKNPSVKITQAIAKQLGCTVEDLLMDDIKIDRPVINSKWRPELFLEIVAEVVNQVKLREIQPELSRLVSSIQEIYEYSIGSPSGTLDLRFMEWIIEKKLSKS